MAFHRSLDNGETWTTSRVMTLNGSCANAVAVHPADEKIIYVGGSSYWPNPTVFKSTNGGAGWADVTKTIKGIVTSLAIDPLSPKIVYAGTREGIFRSQNSGASWTRVFSSPQKYINRIRINPGNPNEVFACSELGVLMSANRGLTWKAIAADLDIRNVAWLDLDPNRRILYAATVGGGICKKEF